MTHLIPNTQPLEASFKITGSSGQVYYDTLPIVAWDEDGMPWVVNPDTRSRQSHRLKPADSYGNYAGVVESEKQYDHVISGQGWTIDTIRDDGTIYSVPVIAFGIRANGWGDPICSDGDGIVQAEDRVDGDKKILSPPDGWPEDQEARAEGQD